MTQWTLSSLHRKKYGNWAGNPGGKPADPARCCETVAADRRIPGQCSRKRGYGPELAYCKQHDPAAQAERDRKAQEKYDAYLEARRLEWAGPSFFEALCKIADGDNNPRQTAADAIQGYERRKT